MIKEKYQGFKAPKAIPMLPDQLNMLNFNRHTDVIKETGIIPIGLDEEHVQPVYADFNKNKHCMILGQAQKGKTNLVKS